MVGLTGIEPLTPRCERGSSLLVCAAESATRPVRTGDSVIAAVYRVSVRMVLMPVRCFGLWPRAVVAAFAVWQGGMSCSADVEITGVAHRDVVDPPSAIHLYGGPVG